MELWYKYDTSMIQVWYKYDTSVIQVGTTLLLFNEIDKKIKSLVLAITVWFWNSDNTWIISIFVLIQIILLVLSHFLLTNNLKVTSRKYKFSIKGRIDFSFKQLNKGKITRKCSY